MSGKDRPRGTARPFARLASGPARCAACLLILLTPRQTLAGEDCPVRHVLPDPGPEPERAQITRGLQRVRADHIDYDRDRDRIRLSGAVQLWREDLFVAGERAELAPEAEQARFFHAEYISEAMQARGRAAAAELLFGQRSLLQQAVFTGCTQARPTWTLHASRLTLDHESERGIARHAVLRLKRFPILYSPWWSFPISAARKSGFLIPRFGSSRRHGMDLAAPWYWNIAPDRDATLTPRWLSDSGILWQGRYRYLSRSSRGEVEAGWLPSDKRRQDSRRALVSLRHGQHFLHRRGRINVDFNWTSDREYLNDFSPGLTLSSIHHLDRVVDVRYAGDSQRWGRHAVALRVQDYQPLTEGAARPYKRLPQLRFVWHTRPRAGGLNFHLDGELVHFERDHPDPLSDVDGLRFDIHPQLHYPVQAPAGFLRPRLGLRYTRYRLWETSPSGAAGPERLVPSLSLDAGLFLERRLGAARHLQTLEPRIFYLYVPVVQQGELPIFDTARHSFDYDLLFRENHFVGRDRVSDAHQIVLSARSALFHGADGRQLGVFRLGQIVHLRDRRVVLPGEARRRSGASPLLLSLHTAPQQRWSLRALGQWNPHRGQAWERVSLRLRYQPAPERVLNLAWRRNQADARVQQTDVSLHWPLGPRWGAVARWNYSLPAGRSLDAFLGVEHQGCCLTVRLVARRFLLAAGGRDDYENGLFFHLQFKGLGSVGEQTVDFLRASIPGYVRRF